MKTRLISFLLLIVPLTLVSFTTHKFYVGVFQLDYKKDKKELQLTTRVFIDDLEKVLEEKNHQKIALATPEENIKSNLFIANYFEENLRFTINNKEQKLEFLGKEYENDILICYFKIPCEKKIKTLKINNTILTKAFAEQQNLLHTDIYGNKKSFLFTNSNTEENLNF